jgi:hypothetical protein
MLELELLFLIRCSKCNASVLERPSLVENNRWKGVTRVSYRDSRNNKHKLAPQISSSTSHL